ncbi:MAG: hypothetical protein IJW76_05230 [Clostridia bacterium]|nr:hypothetical protein [Clostridia bacterium]
MNFHEIQFSFIDHIPKKFFDKNHNEKFCVQVISNLFNIAPSDIYWGNPNKREPDVYIKNHPFEITLVSDKHKTKNLIQRLKKRMSDGFSSDDIQKELLDMIQERANDKSQKRYCDTPTLCMMVPVPAIDWVAKAYESDIIDKLFVSERQIVFGKLKKEYIDTKKFTNIFILVPSLDTSWVLIDVSTDNMLIYQGDVSDDNYPYYEVIDWKGI